MRVSILSSLAFAIACTVFARGAVADESSEAVHPPHHANHVAAFVGVTHEEQSDHATAGIEHEYRLPLLHELLGAGPVVEYVHAEHSAVVAVALVHAHPWRGINLFVGPGYERADGHGEVLVRGGVGYDLHVGGLSVSPTVAFDRIAGHTAAVGGLAVGLGI